MTDDTKTLAVIFIAIAILILIPIVYSTNNPSMHPVQFKAEGEIQCNYCQNLQNIYNLLKKVDEKL
jgi:hypothetical protein